MFNRFVLSVNGDLKILGIWLLLFVLFKELYSNNLGDNDAFLISSKSLFSNLISLISFDNDDFSVYSNLLTGAMSL